MSLKIGRLTLIGTDNEERELKTTGKTFRIGSYLSCDLVLNNADAKKVHCEIHSDAFGRITITNHSKRNPVKVNDVPLKGTRPLYTGSIISILDNKLKWVNKKRFPRNKTESDAVSTPIMGRRRAEQAPNSEPSLIVRKKVASKRITMHHFGAASTISDDEMDNYRNNHAEEVDQERLTRASIVSAARTVGATPPRFVTRNAKVLIRRTIDATYPSPSVSRNKENSNADPEKPEEIKSLMLLKCQSSAMVVTSYSPTATPKKTPKSFACVMSNKNTPRSDYGTPRSILSELNADDLVESKNHTPNTPNAVGSMHIIDFTTPDIYRTPMQKNTPLFKSALKNSIVKTASKANANTDEVFLKKSTVTPTSNKKLRFDTSPSIKINNQNTPAQRLNLSRNTPLRSRVTPNKLNLSACSSQPRKSVSRLSLSVSGTPASLTQQRVLTPNSAKHASGGISSLTPHIKRKSINISTPLKTPKAIFSDADKNSKTPVVSRHSCVKTPRSEHKELVKSGSKSTPKTFSAFNRSKTFILDSPSVSLNKKTEKLWAESEIGETILDKDDTLVYNEEQDSNIIANSQKAELNDNCDTGVLEEHFDDGSIKQLENRRSRRSGKPNSSANISRLSNAVIVDICEVGVTDGSIFHSLQEIDASEFLSPSKPMNTTFEKEAEMVEVQSPARRSIRNLSPKRLSLDATGAYKSPSSSILPIQKSRKSNRLSITTTQTDSIIETSNICETPLTSKVLGSTPSTSQVLTDSEDKLPSSDSTNGGETKNLRRAKKINVTPKFFGIRELVKTPKSTADVNLVGVKELVNSPQVTGIDNVVGVKELFNTPTENNLSNVVGVRELVKTPKPVRGLDDPKGMKELFNTPRRDELTDLLGVKELVKTPLQGNNLSDFIGVKELFTLPKETTGLDDARGMKELFNTPKANPGIENTKGIKELFNTPKPMTGIDNVAGVKELFNTPSMDDLSDVRGVKELVNTPAVRSPQLRGVRELMKTPHVPNYEDADGLSAIFKTPASRAAMILSTPNSVTVEKSTTLSVDLLKTPGEVDVLEGIEEVEEIYQSPVSNLNLFETNCSNDQHLSPEESFDRLAGKTTIRRTYSRLSTTPRVLSIPLAVDGRGESVKTDIQEWVDKVDCNFKDSVEGAETEMEMANESGAKIVGKPLATSSSMKPTARRSRTTKDRINQNDLHEMSGIEQFEESILSASSISAVSLDVDAADNDSSIINYADSGKEKHIPSISRKPLDLSNLKVTPQIQRLRGRVSSPCKGNSVKSATAKPLYQDLSIQFIDESTVNVSNSSINNTSRYNIRPSVNGTDVSLEFIDSHSKSIVNVENDVANSTRDTNESLSVIEALESPNSMTAKLRRSRRAQSEGVIFISDDEKSSRSPSQVNGKSIANNHKTLEFIATNELSMMSNNSAITMNTDAFKSIVDASHVVDESLIESSANGTNPNISIEYLSADDSTLNSTQQHSGLNSSPKRKLVRGASEPYVKLVRLSVSRRITGQMPLNPCFDVQGDQERSNLSLEFANFESTASVRPTRARTMSHDRSKDTPAKNRRTVGQNPINDESLRHESEHLESFEEVSQGDTPMSYDRSKDTPAKNRRTVGQNPINDESEHLESFEEVPQGDTHMSSTSLSGADLDQTQQNLSLEFRNFDDHPAKGKPSRGRSEVFEMQATRPVRGRRTMGGQPVAEAFDLDAEIEQYRLEQEFQNFDANGKNLKPRGQSLNFSVANEVKSPANRRLTVGQQPLNNSLNIDAEHKRKIFEHFEPVPILKKKRGQSLSVSDNLAAVQRTNKNRMTFGDQANTSFDLVEEKKKFAGSRKSTELVGTSRSDASDGVEVIGSDHEISSKEKSLIEAHSAAPDKIRNYTLSIDDEVINEEEVFQIEDESLNMSRQQIPESMYLKVSGGEKPIVMTENEQDQSQIGEVSDVGNRRVHFGENIYYEVNKLDSQYFQVDDDTPKTRRNKAAKKNTTVDKADKQKLTRKATKSRRPKRGEANEDLEIANVTENNRTEHNQEVNNATKKVNDTSEENNKLRRGRKAKENKNYVESTSIVDARKIDDPVEKQESANLTSVSTSNPEARSVSVPNSEGITSAENPPDERSEVAGTPTRNTALRRRIKSTSKGDDDHMPDLPAQSTNGYENAQKANMQPDENDECPKNLIEAPKSNKRPKRGTKKYNIKNTIQECAETEVDPIESAPIPKSRGRRAKAKVVAKTSESEVGENKPQLNTKLGEENSKPTKERNEEVTEANQSENSINSLLKTVDPNLEKITNAAGRRTNRRKANESNPATENDLKRKPFAVGIDDNLIPTVNEDKCITKEAALQPEASASTRSGRGRRGATKVEQLKVESKKDQLSNDDTPMNKPIGSTKEIIDPEQTEPTSAQRGRVKKSHTLVDPLMEATKTEKIAEPIEKKHAKKAIPVSAEELPMVDAKSKEDNVENETKPVKRSRRLASYTEESFSVETKPMKRSRRLVSYTEESCSGETKPMKRPRRGETKFDLLKAESKKDQLSNDYTPMNKPIGNTEEIIDPEQTEPTFTPRGRVKKSHTTVDPPMEATKTEKIAEPNEKKRGKRAIPVLEEELPVVDAKSKEDNIENETKPVKRSRRLVSYTEESSSVETKPMKRSRRLVSYTEESSSVETKPMKRSRRLVSNTEESSSVETTSKTKSARSKLKVPDSQVVTALAQQTPEIDTNTQVNGDDIFKTPLEVKPRTRRARIVSIDAPVVNDAAVVPARTPKPKRGRAVGLLSESPSNVQKPVDSSDEVQFAEKIKPKRGRKRNEVEAETVSSPQTILTEKTATVLSTRTRTRRK